MQSLKGHTVEANSSRGDWFGTGGRFAMLTVLGSPRRVCNGLTRRKLLQVGGAGLFGLSLPKVRAAESLQPPRDARAKSVMFVFLFGGPSQLETFDMKPDAPSGIRGPFSPIASRTPGLRISEYLPRLAQVSDKYCVIRTLNHPQNDHNGCHFIQTGHPLPPADRGGAGVDATDKDWPAMGSVVEHVDRRAAGGKPRLMPSYVYLPKRLGHFAGYDYSGQYAGWLGRAYDALATDIRKSDPLDNPYYRPCNDEELDFRLQGLSDQSVLTLDRLDRRRSLLDQFELARRELDKSLRVSQYNDFRQAAMAMVSSGQLQTALDVRREADAAARPLRTKSLRTVAARGAANGRSRRAVCHGVVGHGRARRQSFELGFARRPRNDSEEPFAAGAGSRLFGAVGRHGGARHSR
jgi:hypothetical protein